MTLQLVVRSLGRIVLLVFGFSFFVNLLSMTLPLYTMQVFDRVLMSKSFDTLWAITAIAALLIAAYGALDALRTRVMLKIDGWIDGILSPEVARTRLERAAEGRRDVARTGLADLRALRQFFAGPSLLLLLDTIWSPLFLVIGFLIHPLLGAVGLLGAAALAFLSVANAALVRDPEKIGNLLSASTAEQTETAARNAEVVEALGMKPAILDRIRKSAEQAREKAWLAMSRSSTIASVTKVLRYFIQIAIMGVGIWLVLNDHLTAGAVFAASMIMGRGLMPFEQMQRTWSTVVSARQSYNQLKEYLGRIEGVRSTMTYPAPRGALQVEGATFMPPNRQRPVLSNVSFQLAPGEALGVIGPSAAGKSTLARLLIGVWRPTAGKIRLDGIDVAQWDRVDFGRHVGYVPQDVELLAGTVRENIARFGEATDAEVIAAATAANAHEMIVRLPQGYDTDIGESGMLLSGGQRQRLALARALFRDPTYIVLDEPNSNLDTEGEGAMLEALQAARARGATIIIIAHRPNLLSFVDKLLVLKEGRLEVFGDRQTVMSRLQPRPTVVPPAAQAAGSSS
jgi:PrtD family type I secretion system ABC transporter